MEIQLSKSDIDTIIIHLNNVKTLLRAACIEAACDPEMTEEEKAMRPPPSTEGVALLDLHARAAETLDVMTDGITPEELDKLLNRHMPISKADAAEMTPEQLRAEGL